MRFHSALILILICPIISCTGQIEPKSTVSNEREEIDKIQSYRHKHQDNDQSSLSKGSVSNGSLVNGKLMPFSGANFHYFDTTSYISGRAFVQDQVRNSVISSYKQMETHAPNRHFCLMECSHEHGGKLYPHRTHQNGLSIDFMVPLLKNGQPYYELDNLGAQHYFMEFDNSGVYSKDRNVTIDFNLIALHILTLQEEALKNGLQIDKVIFKMELKEKLFATENGKKLKKSSIYITKSLTPLINSLHDDHYHIDFKPLSKKPLK